MDTRHVRYNLSAPGLPCVRCICEAVVSSAAPFTVARALKTARRVNGKDTQVNQGRLLVQEGSGAFDPRNFSLPFQLKNFLLCYWICPWGFCAGVSFGWVDT